MAETIAADAPVRGDYNNEYDDPSRGFLFAALFTRGSKLVGFTDDGAAVAVGDAPYWNPWSCETAIDDYLIDHHRVHEEHLVLVQQGLVGNASFSDDATPSCPDASWLAVGIAAIALLVILFLLMLGLGGVLWNLMKQVKGYRDDTANYLAIQEDGDVGKF